MGKTRTTDLKNATSLLQPTRPFFCTTKNPDGTDHAAPFAWMNPISCNPPRVSLALQNERGKKYSTSLQNILRTKEFTINMPSSGMEHTLVRSSFMLEEKYPGKFDRTRFTRIKGLVIEPASIAECAASIECKAFQFIDHGGDHTIILADIVALSYDPDCYDESLAPIFQKVRPLINLSEKRYPDHQEHFFIEPSALRCFDVYYDERLSDAEKDEILTEWGDKND